MRFVALDAKPMDRLVAFILRQIPVTRGFAMNAQTPVPENGAVALATQQMALVEGEQFSVEFHQMVAIIGVVTVEAPEIAASVNKGPNRVSRSQSVFFHVLRNLDPLADTTQIVCLEIGAVIQSKQRRDREIITEWDRVNDTVSVLPFEGLGVLFKKYAGLVNRFLIFVAITTGEISMVIGQGTDPVRCFLCGQVDGGSRQDQPNQDQPLTPYHWTPPPHAERYRLISHLFAGIYSKSLDS